MARMKKGMLPLKEFANLAAVPYTTLMDWVRAGRIKGAIFEETPVGGYWLVPESAAKTLERPKLGRPLKAKTAAGKRTRATK
jgi:predicted site-specific integrase-resolvase